MLYKILCSDLNGGLVFAQYFLDLPPEEQAEQNQKLFELALLDWNLPGEQVMMLDNAICVFCQVNDVRIFIVGDEDELLLLHLLQTLLIVLTKVVFKSKITVNAFVDNYAKTCLAVKELFFRVYNSFFSHIYYAKYLLCTGRDKPPQSRTYQQYTQAEIAILK
ncbi:MAG: hypothetical protein EZS28_026464 [Streblomastix strix]|uniref:Coatomer subunit zeta n=1 Tax=Streblomastix strix TaxID=222440 RepID=A0A5J4V5A3_9EUKA|nr:MAG: hypothetical protein EZS28_026464 [Streblomastix strix]